MCVTHNLLLAEGREEEGGVEKKKEAWMEKSSRLAEGFLTFGEKK